MRDSAKNLPRPRIKDVELLLTAYAFRSEPQLKDQISVHYNPARDIIFHVRKSNGRIQIEFCHRAGMPRFLEYFDRAIKAALDIRRGFTHAVAVGGEKKPPLAEVLYK